MACRSGSEFYSSLCAFAINDDRTDKLSSALPLFNFFWIRHRRVEMKLLALATQSYMRFSRQTRRW